MGSGLRPPSEIRPHSVGPFSEMTHYLLSQGNSWVHPLSYAAGTRVFLRGKTVDV